MPTRIYGGYVYTGLGAGAYSEDPDKGTSLNQKGTSGFAYGLDQENGTIIWSFRTVTDDFWGNPELNSGAGIWFPPAIDIETGMTFWTTGNPAPMPGTIDYPNASSQPALNLSTMCFAVCAAVFRRPIILGKRGHRSEPPHHRPNPTTSVWFPWPVAPIRCGMRG